MCICVCRRLVYENQHYLINSFVCQQSYCVTLVTNILHRFLNKILNLLATLYIVLLNNCILKCILGLVIWLFIHMLLKINQREIIFEKWEPFTDENTLRGTLNESIVWNTPHWKAAAPYLSILPEGIKELSVPPDNWSM